MERGGGSITKFSLSSSVLPTDLSVDSPIAGGEIRVTSDQPVPVTGEIANGSSQSISGVELSIEPSDSSISVSGSGTTSVGSLAGGASESVEWTVTLPGDLPSGDYSIDVVATYTSGGSEFEVSSTITFTVTG